MSGTNRINGITFDGLHSYYDFGMWIGREKPDWGNPLPKVNVVEVPGMDGALDMTEANGGEVKFYNRTIVLPFVKMVPAEQQEAFKALVRNAIHGKTIRQIIADDDPEWFYTGRATVEFQELMPWRLKIVVTVDAAPYAMRINETDIYLNYYSLPVSANRITLAENVSPRNYNSVFNLGTRTFPLGLVSTSSAIVISWLQSSVFLQNRSITVKDVNDNTYTASISAPKSAGEFRLDRSAVVAAGVDLSLVFNITISGIGGCSLFREDYVSHLRIENARKSVVPIVSYSGEDSVHIIAGGVDYYILPGINEDPDFVIRGGVNDLYLDIPDINGELYITFREGKL